MLKKTLFKSSFKILLLVTGLFFTGCGAPQPQTTSLTNDDYDLVVSEMVASLSKSKFLSGRNEQSPPIEITMRKVRNLTNDLIPQREQWMIMARICGALPMGEFARTRNVYFLMPPEHWAQLVDQGVVEKDNFKPGDNSLYLMTGTFRSARRTGKDDGFVDLVNDYYNLEFQIIDSRTRKIVFYDSVEFRRRAEGLSID